MSDATQVAAETAQAETQKILLDAQRTLVAAQAGLPEELGELLKGSTKEELEAHAETLKAFAKPAETPADPGTSADGGTRREQPTWTVDAVRKLAKENPTRFNDMVDNGQIDLGRIV